MPLENLRRRDRTKLGVGPYQIGEDEADPRRPVEFGNKCPRGFRMENVVAVELEQELAPCEVHGGIACRCAPPMGGFRPAYSFILAAVPRDDLTGVIVGTIIATDLDIAIGLVAGAVQRLVQVRSDIVGGYVDRHPRNLRGGDRLFRDSDGLDRAESCWPGRPDARRSSAGPDGEGA